MAKEYIEREAVIGEMFAEYGSVASQDVLWQLTETIRCIPAADVAPVVRGQWIDKNAGNATCSVCKRRHKNVYDDDASDLFCRSCGAKMEVQDD